MTPTTQIKSTIKALSKYVTTPESDTDFDEDLCFYLIPPRQDYSPSQRLMAAVLLSGVRDLLLPKRNSSQKQLHRTAKFWLTSKADHGLYSYRSICQHLGISSSYLLERLLELSKPPQKRKSKKKVKEKSKK